MSFTDKKTSSTQNSSGTIDQTTTPNVPTWISDPAQAMAGTVGTLQAQGPSAFTPTASPLQTQVQGAAANLTPSSDYSDATSGFNGVGDISADQVQGQSLLTNLSDYYNPFKDQVLNPVLNDYDFQAGQTTAAQAAAAAQNRAFQGSRYGIQEGETAGALARGRATTEGGLLNQMFDTSTSLSSADAERRQAAMVANQGADLSAAQSNQNAGLAKAQGLLGVDSAKNAEQLAQLSAQDTIGQQATDEQQKEQQYPLTFQAQMEGLLAGVDPSLYTGSTTKGTTTGAATGTETVSDPIGQISKLLAAASGFVPKG